MGPRILGLALALTRWLATVEQLVSGATDDERGALYYGTASRFYRLERGLD